MISTYAKAGVPFIAALAALATVVGPALAAPSARAVAVRTPAVSVALSAKSVREPGKLTVTLHVSSCVSDVEADSWNPAHLSVAHSSTVKGSGRSFKVTFTFTSKAPSGKEVIADVFARPCGSTRAGQLALLPSKGSFPGFLVTRV